MEELSNRQSALELDQDHNPSTTLFVSFPSKIHGVTLHNIYVRGNDILLVCTLLKNKCGIINYYSFEKFKQQHVSNWIKNKAKRKAFWQCYSQTSSFIEYITT